LSSDQGLIFVDAYSGLGDAILVAPVLMALQRQVSERLAFPANPALDLLQEFDVGSLREITPVPATLRRFFDSSVAEVARTFATLKITQVLNLRRDRVRFGERYLSFAAELADRGIPVHDVGERYSPQDQLSMHTVDLWRGFLAGLGYEVPMPNPGWLRWALPDLPSGPDRDTVACYLGAGQPTKRPRPAFWVDVVREIVERGRRRVVLIPGATAEERADTDVVVRSLRRAGVDHEVLRPSSLAELTVAVAGMPLVISPDTYMIHLTRALAVPVIGVYCSTDPVVYGPYGDSRAAVRSPYYRRCGYRNDLGNCDGWDVGCIATPCKDELTATEVVDLALSSLALGFTGSRR